MAIAQQNGNTTLPRAAAGARGSTHMTVIPSETPGELPHGRITRSVLVTFYEVYNELGSGFLESIYQTAIARALAAKGVRVDREVPLDVFFRYEVIGRYFADLVVEERVIVEVKSVRRLIPEHQVQVLHYLRATAMEVGLLLNFGPRPQFRRFIFSNARKRGLPPP